MIDTSNKNMSKKIKTVEDINDDLLKEIQASDLRTFIENRLAEGSQDWAEKIQAKVDEIAGINATLVALQEQFNVSELAKTSVEAQLAEIQSQIAAKLAEDSFQIRMSTVNDKYELTDDDRAFLVDEIKACETDEKFEKLSKKYEVLLNEKNKEVIAARTAAAAPTAVVTEVIASTVLEGETQNTDLPNNGINTTVTLSDRMNKAFGGENTKISIKK